MHEKRKLSHLFETYTFFVLILSDINEILFSQVGECHFSSVLSTLFFFLIACFWLRNVDMATHRTLLMEKKNVRSLTFRMR